MALLNRGIEAEMVSDGIALRAREDQQDADLLQLEQYLVRWRGSILFLGRGLRKLPKSELIVRFGNVFG
jgi:hypothetical protein